MDSENELNENGKNNEMKGNIILNKIRSLYILKKIINNVKEIKFLQIIKCNNVMQERLELSKNYYKYYSQILTEIELEIEPVKNGFGKFINILNKEEENYYHIFFDDDQKEIKRTYLEKNDKPAKIKVIIDYQVKSFEKLFHECLCVESICFKKFYRTNINNMSNMFTKCSSLKHINFNSFNTNNVTDMSYMFSEC